MKTPELTPRQLGNIRLMQLAQILDASSFRYTQRMYRDPEGEQGCGTPACALGHWAYHNRDRWVWEGFDGPWLPECMGTFSPACTSAMQEFDLTACQFLELFGVHGCNRAQTARDAAEYIRAFVTRRLLNNETTTAEPYRV